MGVADCPRCGNSAESAGERAFCPNCGWNGKQAAEDLRVQLKVLPYVFGSFLVVALITWHSWRGVAVLCGFASIVTATNYVKSLWQRHRLKLQSTMDQKFHSSGLGASAGIVPTDFVIPKRFQHLPNLIPPRQLKMKRVFRALFFLLAFIAITFAWVCVSLLIPPHKHPDDPRDGLRLLWIPSGILFALVWSFLSERRRRRLLTKGKVVFALVKGSKAGRGALLPGIIYQFQTAKGKDLEDFDQDWTDSFHVGMVVPVFYDPAKPENHVAMCASFYDVS
jgi:hypothetical protein